MDYPELRGYLVGACSPEEVALMDRAVSILDSYAVDEYMDQFATIIGEASGRGDTDTIDAIKATMMLLTNQLVMMHGITISDSVMQSGVLDILQALHTVSSWADKEQIDRILKQDVSVEERVAELFGAITGQPDTHFMPMFAVVEPGLIQLLAQHGKDAESEMDGFDEVARSYVEDYKKLRIQTHQMSLWSDFVLHSLPALGMPFHVHLAKFLSDKNDAIAAINTEPGYWHLAAELLGVACISDVRLAGALPAIAEEMGDIFSDLNRTTALTAALNKLYAEVNRAQA